MRTPVDRFPSPSGKVPKPIASLVILQARARLLREECDIAVAQYLESQPPTPPRLSPSAFRLWTFLSLWLAYLWVVIEGYRDAYKTGHPLADPEVDRLLASPFSDQLRVFRNKIFHPNTYDHQAVKTILEDHAAVRAWAEELSDAFDRYLRSYMTS